MRASGEDAGALSLLEQTDRWFRASGGGDGALLTRCLLASRSSLWTGSPGWRPRQVISLRHNSVLIRPTS
jgi:hypothetical protein